MHIPEEYRNKITSDEINDLPLRRYDGPVDLITSSKQLEHALSLLEGERVLGFDTETKPSFKKGVCHPPALIQLATAERVILFQISRMGLPAELCDIFANPDVVKTGVAVHDDVKGLERITPFTAASFVDLGDISRSLGLLTNGLRNMAANFMSIRISKGARRSNWGQRILTKRQIAYAATDAWISRELYLRMHELGFISEPS